MVNIKGFANELGLTLAEVREAIAPLLATATNTQRHRIDILLTEDVPEATAFTDQSVNIIDRQINVLLALSRVGHRALAPGDVDMNALMREALASQAHRIEMGGIQVDVGDLPIVTSDRIAMEQIISNLLDNALKYLDPSRLGRISVNADRIDGETRFHVHDNGVGIAQQDLKRVFQVFHRVGSQRVAGEGVGLSYAQANARRLGGDIWCQSEVGAGSTFSFSVPDRPPSSEPSSLDAYAVPPREPAGDVAIREGLETGSTQSAASDAR